MQFNALQAISIVPSLQSRGVPVAEVASFAVPWLVEFGGLSYGYALYADCYFEYYVSFPMILFMPL